jgi:uncharacterized protein with PIN domain
VTHVQKDDDLVYATKRCPECFGYTELDAKRCPMCKTRLGKVQKHGMAKRTVNWNAYVVFLVAFLAFAPHPIYIFTRIRAILKNIIRCYSILPRGNYLPTS